jgi:hypothetical protein
VVWLGVVEPTISHGEVVAAIAYLVLRENAGQGMASDPLKRRSLVIKDAGREPCYLAVEDPYPPARDSATCTLDHIAMVPAARLACLRRTTGSAA